LRTFAYGALRTALIGYGVALFGYFFARSGVHEPPESLAEELLLGGLALQVGVLAVRWLLKGEGREQILGVVELIADGVTVLLFALATFQGIARFVG
jgi:hypothetical protein